MVDQTSNSGANFRLPVQGGPFERPAEASIEKMQTLGSATACAKLNQIGIGKTFVEGPRPLELGKKIVGSAITLQFMPKREDIIESMINNGDGIEQEYVERDTALWRVLETVQPGDVLVIQAYGSKFTGVIGDILAQYFKQKGGAGIIVDGSIRDSERIREMGIPVWCTGVTPHYASQTELFPWAYDVPVAVGGVLCMPGDIVIADDDGPVIVPQALADEVYQSAQDHQEWEVFSRARLAEGARLSDYYPLTPDSREEYNAWRVENPVER